MNMNIYSLKASCSPNGPAYSCFFVFRWICISPLWGIWSLTRPVCSRTRGPMQRSESGLSGSDAIRRSSKTTTSTSYGADGSRITQTTTTSAYSTSQAQQQAQQQSKNWWKQQQQLQWRKLLIEDGRCDTHFVVRIKNKKKKNCQNGNKKLCMHFTW